MPVVAGGGEAGANPALAQGGEQLGYAGKDREALMRGDFQKSRLLGLAQPLTFPPAGARPQDGRHQVISPLADLERDAVGRNTVAAGRERADPGFHMPRIGVDQRPVDIEDDTVQRHAGNLVRRGYFPSPSRMRSTRRPCARGLNTRRVTMLPGFSLWSAFRRSASERTGLPSTDRMMSGPPRCGS